MLLSFSIAFGTLSKSDDGLGIGNEGKALVPTFLVPGTGLIGFKINPAASNTLSRSIALLSSSSSLSSSLSLPLSPSSSFVFVE